MIDNFQTIEDNLLQFKEGSYYKFEALVRNTDGNNELYFEGASNTNKNILIKTWWIESEERYVRMKNEMKTLCDMTGARLYVLLDRKNYKKTLVGLAKISNDLLIDYYVSGNTEPPLSAIQKIPGTASSRSEASDRETRMWMFDIDCNDFELLRTIQSVCYPHKYFTLSTNKGYHVCVPKKGFPRPDRAIGAPMVTDYPYLFKKREYWAVQDNAMGLVYMPDKKTLSSV